MRHLGLDLLRFVAVLLVLGRHLHLPEDSGWLLTTWQRGGWIGVDLFFVLSGFLVSSLLFKEQQRRGSADVRQFLIRRAFKIYPAFWLLLIFTLVVSYFQGRFPAYQSVVGEVLFLQNYLGGVWGHTWSLAVEEHFYIGLAIAFVLLTSKAPAMGPKASLNWIVPVFVLVATTCLGLRVLAYLLHPAYAHEVHLFPTHLRIDSLFFGVLLSYLYHFRDLEQKISPIATWQLGVAGGLLLSPAFLLAVETHHWIAIFGVIMFYVGSGCWLLAILRLADSQLASLRWLGTLGAASYSVYLWHMVVNSWIYLSLSNVTGNRSFAFYFVVYICGSFLWGWYMNRMIEGPILYLREQWFPKRVQHSAIASTSDGAQAGERGLEQAKLGTPSIQASSEAS